MKSFTSIAIITLIAVFFVQCKKKETPEPPPAPANNIEVIINNIPYPTEKFLRIGYTLRMWEYEKDGLELEKIVVIDPDTKTELMALNKADFPYIWKDPIPQIPFFTFDKLTHYYLSIQLPIPLGLPKPLYVTHRFEFMDTIQNQPVIIEGAPFSPRINETPLIIASPVKGKNWLFVSQSTMGYHFYVFLFVNGNMWSQERFAFDNMQFNDELNDILDGPPEVNESYFNYGDTLYAVANGVVVGLQDGIEENHGDTQDKPPQSVDGYPGNFLILDIGSGHYAAYGHCIPNSFFVSLGDILTEGDPIALLGNSGASGMPHLHFQICDRPNFNLSKGIPFVLKEYTKTNEFDLAGNLLNPPVELVVNSMMEERSVIEFQ